MKKILILTLTLIAIQLHADLTVSVLPGYTFSDGETRTTAKMNLLGRPTVGVSGTLSGTNALGAQTVVGTHLNNSIVGSNLTFDASHNLVIKLEGVMASQLDSNAFAGSLQGGAGNPVSNRTDNSSIIVNANRQLTIATNAAVETTLTNTDFALIFSTRTNGLGGGTNKVFELTKLLTLQAFLSNAIIMPTFTSGLGTIAAGPILNAAHGFSNTPVFVRAVLVCTVTNADFSVGDEIDPSGVFDPGDANHAGWSYGANTSNVWMTANSVILASRILSKTNGAERVFTAASWNAKIYARP